MFFRDSKEILMLIEKIRMNDNIDPDLKDKLEEYLKQLLVVKLFSDLEKIIFWNFISPLLEEKKRKSCRDFLLKGLYTENPYEVIKKIFRSNSWRNAERTAEEQLGLPTRQIIDLKSLAKFRNSIVHFPPSEGTGLLIELNSIKNQIRFLEIIFSKLLG